MKSISYLSPSIVVGKTEHMGRGVYAIADIKANEVIEISPVIVMSKTDRGLLDKTALHDYIFEWGGPKEQCCMALGYVPLYNHAYQSNCEYEMNFKKQIITIKTMKPIKMGAELFINYNGDWNNTKPLWFDAQ